MKDKPTTLVIPIHDGGNEPLLVQHALLLTTMNNLPIAPAYCILHSPRIWRPYRTRFEWSLIEHIIYSPPITNLQQVIKSLALPVRSVRYEIGHRALGFWSLDKSCMIYNFWSPTRWSLSMRLRDETTCVFVSAFIRTSASIIMAFMLRGCYMRDTITKIIYFS